MYTFSSTGSRGYLVPSFCPTLIPQQMSTVKTPSLEDFKRSSVRVFICSFQCKPFRRNGEFVAYYSSPDPFPFLEENAFSK